MEICIGFVFLIFAKINKLNMAFSFSGFQMCFIYNNAKKYLWEGPRSMTLTCNSCVHAFGSSFYLDGYRNSL